MDFKACWTARVKKMEKNYEIQACQIYVNNYIHSRMLSNSTFSEWFSFVSSRFFVSIFLIVLGNPQVPNKRGDGKKLKLLNEGVLIIKHTRIAERG